MKVKTMMTTLILLLATLILPQNSSAQSRLRSAGIGVRGSFWKMNTFDQTHVVVTNSCDECESSVVVGSVGGWFTMFSRVNYNTWLEFHVGAIAHVEEKVDTYSWDNEVTDVCAVTPLLLGLKYDLFTQTNTNALRPYVTFGGGPYWVSNIHAEDRIVEEEVTVDTKLKRGAYAGGGFHFLLSDWFAVNFDMKYHFINFNVNHPYSGFDYGLGVSVMWGHFTM